MLILCLIYRSCQKLLDLLELTAQLSSHDLGPTAWWPIACANILDRNFELSSVLIWSSHSISVGGSSQSTSIFNAMGLNCPSQSTFTSLRRNKVKQKTAEQVQSLLLNYPVNVSFQARFFSRPSRLLRVLSLAGGHWKPMHGLKYSLLMACQLRSQK